ncbi:TonB-dependent receptor domain-containing protein [Granulicella cerasi]|uniref:TonB-dependent receptor domain-containing protein n=1 Tax=Granulicella cerasi TaxID=741063 RepID=A0ABW1ZCH6_9BACT|nr:TonB-dependent receptor [Granulicella cerasi]
MMRRGVFGSAVLLAAPVLVVTAAHAQSAGSVRGIVRDAAQLPVANAQVSLDGDDVHLRFTTDANGTYTLTNVPPGNYTLTAQRADFQPVSLQLRVVSGPAFAQDLIFTRARSDASVTVTAPTTGTTAQGYYIDRVDRGVLGETPIVDQPAVITTASADLLQNLQVKSFRDAMHYMPLVQFTEQQGPEVLRPATRGMQGSIAQNTRMDGMAMAITGANPMEQYQELQVQNGLGAAMYGPANPSGMFDFVLKRPTDAPTRNIYLEQDSSSVGTIYGDFSDRLGKHKWFGYRTNLLFGDGTQFVEASRLRRRLGMFAFDARITPTTTIDAHYSAYDLVQRGYPGWFTYGPNTAAGGTTQNPAPSFVLPAAPDPRVRGFGQAYAGVNLTTQSTSARILHDFSPNWHAAAGGLAQRLDRFIDTPVNVITSNNGDYRQSLATGFAPRFGVESDLGYITGILRKWGLQQDVVVASEGYRFNQYAYTAPAAASVLLGTANVAHPVIFAPPAAGLPKNTDLRQSAVVHQQGFNLGDFIHFPHGLGIRVAASQDWIGADNYTWTAATRTNARTSGSNKQGISPSASVLYKFGSTLTAYGTFASSLQQGDLAPTSAALVNSGQSLAPYRSKQWEMGVKSDPRPIAFTAALFRLERPFANTVAYNGSATQTIFKIVGQQVNFGAELQAQGTLFNRLLIDGGFTALNSRLNGTQIAATDGKRFVGIPGYRAGLYSEYRVPGVQRLSLTGSWQFIGQRPQDDENLHTTPGSSTFDFGFRYARTVHKMLATLRFNCQNITDTRYYSTIAAGDITGTNASSNVAHIGTPRTISSGLQLGF